MEQWGDLRISDWILTAFVLLQLFYFFFFFLRLAVSKGKIDASLPEEGVSIIIATRNQMEMLKAHLPHWLSQDYPQFQVIVVNDGSWDETPDLLKAMAADNSKLKVVTLNIDERYHKGKKFALTMGIKAADYNWLLFTDTDCIPSSNQWIRRMMQSRLESTEIVLGYSPYQRKNSLINLFIQYETFLTAQQYLSSALAGMPYMGVGRNLMYSKELFFRYKGFASHQHILSGDDDLFVNETATPENTAVCYHTEASVYSVPKNTLGEWIRQKNRHLSTAKYYKWLHQWTLGTWSVVQFLFYALLAALLIAFPEQWQVPCILYGSKMLIQFVIYGVNMKKLQLLFLLPFMPLLDVALLLYYLTVGLDGFFSKPQTWNG